MVQVNSFKANNKYFLNNKQSQVQPTEKLSSKRYKTATVTSVGIGLTALAVSGIYLLKNKKANVLSIETLESAFEGIRNADSIMERLKKTETTPDIFKQLLFKITGDEGLSEKFIAEVTSDPRKSKENTRILHKKIGGDKPLMDWMLHLGGYQEAFYKHTTKLFERSDIGPDTLISQSPNWTIWRMREKFGHDFSFGQLPEEFSSIDKYREVFYRVTAGENSENVFGNVVFLSPPNRGQSCKGIKRFDAGGRKYILKYQDADRWLDNQDIKADLSMKSDSTFLNAQLERYLTLNGYEGGPKLRFYDYKTNSAVYEMTEGSMPGVEEVSDILNANERMKDLNELGVYYHDLNTGNIRIGNNGEYNFIDSGEAAYVDFFKPGCGSYHFSLPNLNGRSITDTAAAINLSK